MSEVTARISAGYAFAGPALRLGAVVHDGACDPAAQVRIPLSMLNRHGLITGATGTGKTKTLQLLAEQLSEQGVAVFAADVKGDLSGLATPGSSLRRSPPGRPRWATPGRRRRTRRSSSRWAAALRAARPGVAWMASHCARR